MIRPFALALFIGLCVAAPAADARQVKVEDLANDAIDVIGSRSPTPLDDYLILMCTSDREDALSKDSDIGPLVRLMSSAGADLAVVVMPAGLNAGATFAVYFKKGLPLGFVALPPSKSKPTDADVATAFARLSSAVPKLKRRPTYEAGVINADDGTEIYTLKIVGWQ